MREAPSVVVTKVAVAVSAVPTRPTTVCVAGTSCPEALMVTVNVEIPKLVPSDTVMTCVVTAFTCVGVPETTPVDEFNDKPPGNAGVMANVFEPVTAGAVIAVVGVIATPTKPTRTCDAGVTAVADTDADVTVIDTVAVADAVPSDTVMV